MNPILLKQPEYGTSQFDEKVLSAKGAPLRKESIEILQVNVGKLCNLSCVHCHVEAGPTKLEENMDAKTADAVLRFLVDSKIKTLDLTGGAPEMNPYFRKLVKAARELGVHVIDRCNLTVFFVKGQEDLPEFLKDHQVEVIASLPCYSKENVDKQRGSGTFDESIRALLKLNELGYGKERAGLELNLVYNPVGPHLPPLQAKLEKDYKERLSEDFGVVFNRLYTITNMPIKRYTKYLKVFGQLESYEKLLFESFNPGTLDGLMCRNTLSVSWDGKLYDCDFNQMLGLSLRATLRSDEVAKEGSEAISAIAKIASATAWPRNDDRSLTIFDATPDDLHEREIQTANHCFGCTAGTGSSCQGALA